MVKKQASNSSLKKKKARSSWDQIRGLVGCNSTERSSCGKLCTLRDVVHGNTRIVHRGDKSPELTTKKSGGGGGGSGGGGGMPQLRKLSGCYECNAVVDLSRHPMPRHVINTFPCSQCGEIFTKFENLEFHQTLNHAVSELSLDDSSRNIVEIIFKSSWVKKEKPICEIERILKVHNTQRTIQRFEEHRSAVKQRAKRNANARCAVDGNELLRFHPAAITCDLGAGGSSSLCGSNPACGICTIIGHGFRSRRTSWGAICTTAGSGRADDYLVGGSGTRRAAMVCRVIAGRVKPRVEDGDAAAAEVASSGSYDSLAGCAAAYSNIDELFVFSSRAILPCFVVIYKALE